MMSDATACAQRRASVWRRAAFALGMTIAALIHLLPVVGVLGADALRELYGVAIGDPTLLVLLRHRALLFGLLGVMLLASIARSALRTPALVAGIVSTASFLLIALDADGHSRALQRVVIADVVALVALLIAALANPAIRGDGAHRSS
jgi:hypothetical protein